MITVPVTRMRPPPYVVARHAQAFSRRLTCLDEKRAAHAAERAGAVAADAALGWECVRELTGHTAALRDVAFNPRFQGLPPQAERELGQRGAKIDLAVEQSPGKDVRANNIGPGSGKVAHAILEGKSPTKPEHMLASASADLTLRIWDLSFNPRIPRFVRQKSKAAGLRSWFLVFWAFAQNRIWGPLSRTDTLRAYLAAGCRMSA